MTVRILHGDALEQLRTLADESVHSVVTDPPYGLEFMGKDWDNFAPRDRKNATVWDGRRQAQDGWQEDAAARSGKGGGGPSYKATHKGARRCATCGKRAFSGTPCTCETPDWIVEHRQEAPSAMLGFQAFCEAWAREVYRVLKPGGHLLSFGGSRTYHRMACAIEDAGFEIRDQIMWVYGSGFPKSLDVSKAIDKARADNAGWIAVGQWLRTQREAAGLKQKEVAALWPSVTGGLTGCVANWELGFNCPTWDQWQQLKERIGFGDEMDGEVWRLNGRKGTPGEAWATAEVLAIDKRMNEASGIVAAGRDERVEVEREIKAANSDAARQWQGWGTALKPAHEDIVLAQKPYDLRALCGILAQKITDAICQLPSFAKDAESNSSLSQSVYGGAFDSARWDAVARCNTPDALFALMATLPSASAIPLSLSTGLSWLSTLGEVSNRASTFTTETASSLTTDLRTLNCSPSKITPLCIIGAATRQSGIASSALLVANIFSAVRSRLEITRALSAQDPATSSDDGPALRPDHAPIVLARKPLIGTVAANVLAHGTGALNIDGCRVSIDGDERETIDARSGAGQSTEGWGHIGNRDAGETYKSHALGRWPANLILSYPEDEYEVRSGLTAEQKRELYGWLGANA